MSYASKLVREQLERGTRADEGFFRVKVTGLGETKWFNVTPAQLEAFARILEGD